MRVIFDKIDGNAKIYDGTRYLTLFDTKIRYFVSLISSATYIFYHYFSKNKVDAFDSLPIIKTLSKKTFMLQKNS